MSTSATINAGLLSRDDAQVATVVWSTRPGFAFLGGGELGSGNVYELDESTMRWSVVGPSNSPGFAGNHCATGPIPDSAPRNAGKLIATYAATPNADPDYIWAASFKDGVLRYDHIGSTGLGGTWKQVGSASLQYLRGLAANPPHELFVAAYGKGVYHTTQADSATPSSASWTLLAGGPSQPEELVYYDGALWAAAWDGIYRYGSSGGWTKLENPDANAQWLGIAGAEKSGHPSLIVSNVNASASGGVYHDVYQSSSLDGDPGSIAWTSISGPPPARARSPAPVTPIGGRACTSSAITLMTVTTSRSRATAPSAPAPGRCRRPRNGARCSTASSPPPPRASPSTRATRAAST